MLSQFEMTAALASRAIDRTFGARMRIIPMQRKDNFGKPIGAFDGRLPLDVIGAFIERRHDLGFLSGDRQNVDFSARISSVEAWASIDRRRFPEGAQPRTGDRIELLDRSPALIYEALDVIPDGPSRWGLPLVRAS